MAVIDKNIQTPWKFIRSEPGPDLRLFQVRYDWLQNPRNSKVLKAVILEVADWVDVVALTPEKKIVVVRQYRFGAGKTSTEIPAGVVDADETPEQAAIRELREETGYTSRHWKYLGWVEPNPAFQNNLCHQWLATDVAQTHSPNFDEGEDISVSEMSFEELRREINEGRMRNSLALLALSRVFDLWNLAS